jgi:hypothetical protein
MFIRTTRIVWLVNGEHERSPAPKMRELLSETQASIAAIQLPLSGRHLGFASSV